MKRTLSSLPILLVVLTFVLPGCKTREPASNTTAQPSSSVLSNANRSENSNRSSEPEDTNRNAGAAKKTETPATTKSEPSSQLVGTYEAREIQDKGIVTLVSKVRTLISFSANGTYTRVSQHGGQTYHSDSGQFRVEAPDKLVLTIQMSAEKSKPKIQNPPLQRTHTFSLSSDGEELRLTKNGSTAVFHRVSNPKSS